MRLEEQIDFLARAEMAEDVCHYLADRVRRMRRQSGESQATLAARADVPLRTYKRFETHGRGSLETFVRVLMAMERTRYFFQLFPQEVPQSVARVNVRSRPARHDGRKGE